MSLQDVFKFPFNLTQRLSFSHPASSIRFRFKTVDIEGETTLEEAYILSKMYFDNVFEHYKNYWINTENPTESSFYLFLGHYIDYDITNYRLRRIAYDCEREKIMRDEKYEENETIEGKFFIGINVDVYSYEDYDQNMDYDDDEDYEVKKTMKINLIFYTQNVCILLSVLLAIRKVILNHVHYVEKKLIIKEFYFLNSI